MAAQEDANGVFLNGGFTSFVSDLIHRKHSEEGPGHPINNSQLGVGINISKDLPAIGVRQNTKEWQVKEAERGGNGGDSQSRNSSQSFSSSLPFDAEGRDDSRSISQRGNNQERVEGQGWGQHEKLTLDGFDDYVAESPVEGHGDYSSIPAPKNLANSVRMIRLDDSTKGAKEEQFANQPISRSSRVQNQIPDEVWRFPDQLRGMKSEHKQGPMNEIYLEPRITPIHVNYFLFLDFLLC